MHKRFTTPATLALLTAGLVGASWSPAWADPQTDGSGGVASGNQVNVPVDIEADLCGNSLAVLGISEAQCTEVSKVLYSAGDEGRDSAPQTDGSGGAASGNQIDIPIDAALDICGNSAAIGGVSKADCTEVVNKLAEESGDGDGDAPKTDGSGGVTSGNQITIPVDTAVNICGNSIAVLGASKAECTTIVNIIGDQSPGKESGGAETDGSGGVASGNQIDIPVDAAVNICGNAVSVLGIAEADCLTKVGHEGGKDEEEPEEPGDGGKDEEKPEEPEDGGKEEPGKEEEKAEETEEPAAPAEDDPAKTVSSSTGGLPVTGAALGGLVAAAAAATGVGAGAMYLSRKRRAAAAAADTTED